ncbi:MAG: ribosome maturation factor RimM [candidate division Zixibacteria bacterium]
MSAEKASISIAIGAEHCGCVMVEQQQFITVGQVGRTRGVDGELYITPHTDFPDRFLDMKAIYMEHQGNWEKMNIRSLRLVSDRPVVRFDGIKSREDAMRLTNKRLAVPRDEVVELPEDMFFVFDLIGCRALEAGTKRFLGEVTDVRSYPANDAYVIRTADGTEVLFPAVKQYVKEVDIEGKTIVIEPAGLFDIE